MLVPWAVDTVKKFNECAAGKAELIEKIRNHNKKSAQNGQALGRVSEVAP